MLEQIPNWAAFLLLMQAMLIVLLLVSIFMHNVTATALKGLAEAVLDLVKRV